MKTWAVLVFLPGCVQLLLSLCLQRGSGLTILGDLAQCILLSAAFASAVTNSTRLGGKNRLFWLLVSSGFATWLLAQILWTYFEVGLRREVPNPFIGDVVLFLHIVPLMAALAVGPHLQSDSRAARIGSIDFVLLLVWWLYLFLFVVIPWQYVDYNELLYGRSFDLLYLSEHVVFLVCLALVWRKSKRGWKTVYAQFFGAALLYAVSSVAASVAIDYHVYYTGSLFDVPLIAAMGWFLLTHLTAQRAFEVSEITETVVRGHDIWSARLAMAAVFSTPVMIVWASIVSEAPQRVRTYRLLLTVVVMLVMGVLVFSKQHLLDRELLFLLQTSHKNLDEMFRLKDALEQKERSLRWHSKELQRKNLELQEVSFTDSLTQTWNRRYLEETLAADSRLALRSHQRSRNAPTLNLIFYMVDIDFFKRVNDEHGHAVGDELLRKVAERLSGAVRKSDILVRWGGEEFLVMSRSTDRTGATVFCHRTLDAICSEPFDLSGGIRLRKTCSIGWAPYPWCDSAIEAMCAEEVIELADSALYVAKASGRNQSVGFLPSDAAMASPEHITLQNLRAEKSSLVKVVKSASTNRGDHCEDPLVARSTTASSKFDDSSSQP
jgi:diguanylate cyclase (GGDEF)-like protein